ncbi:c-type cytochrome [Pseudooceanicola nanhaiensis]|uniref:c-type cytochrome n=1 Tax=Pseudooceanicola nanhaiensis TaxID=375761 RepID=UPI001CD401FE|nr:cytochrome c [Pseudooceanicola nanhaiensis]MCA0921619.1 cytochrome c [Pseudooceanicola nanhaiensis]
MYTLLRLVFVALLVAALGAGAFWVLTRPGSVDTAAFASLQGDAGHGKWVFDAGGCASCHAAPGASGEAKLTLAGGKSFASDFGTFLAPNISPDPKQGIGAWSLVDLANAMQRGVSPEGRHYYPAFPYTAYIHATPQDIADLWAYLQTLPPSDTPSQPHQVGFPFNISRGIGLWKALYLTPDFVQTSTDEEVLRGRYLVEALGHCAECHTPRNALGGLEKAQWLTGAQLAGGAGRAPGLTPDHLDWSAEEIAEYLSSGFTPDFDSAGGEMTDVVENTAKLSQPDRLAIAAYLKSLPTP